MSTITPTVADDPQAITGIAPTAADSNATVADVDALDAQVAALQSGGISLIETLEIALKTTEVCTTPGTGCGGPFSVPLPSCA